MCIYIYLKNEKEKKYLKTKTFELFEKRKFDLLIFSLFYLD